MADPDDVADRRRRAAAFEFEIIDPSTDEASEAMGRYAAELDERFVGGFGPDASADLFASASAMAAPDGAFVVARADGAVAACGGVQRIDDTTGEIKRMWVDPSWRGVGLGRRQLAELERLAGALGYVRVVLDTNSSLTAAITMYEAAGYRAIARYNDNPFAQRWFGKDLDAEGRP